MLPLILACAKPVDPLPSAMDLPHLPSPIGDVYTRHQARPTDATVASVVRDSPWDEVLAGAATGVALALADGREVDAYALRWHAIRAGYPYPVRIERVARVPAGEVPPDLTTLAGYEDVDVGLVRARYTAGDVWVMLVGDPRGTLPALAREHGVGATIPTLGFLLSDPLGQIRPPADEVRLDMAGEWLVHVGEITVPLYVGEDTPSHPPIEGAVEGATPEDQARAVLTHVWDWYERGLPDFDPSLDSVARARLRDVLAGRDLPAERQLRAAGYVGVPVGAATCRAVDAVQCLDEIWWSPDRRGVLAGDFESVGLAVGFDAEGLVMVVVAAG